METWQRTLVAGILPSMTTPHLERLRKGLVEDDPRLIHGGTTWPPWTTDESRRLPCEGACAMAYPFLHDNSTVGEVVDGFSTLYALVGQRRYVGTYAVSAFLMAWDHGDPVEMRAAVLTAVEQELTDRIELTE